MSHRFYQCDQCGLCCRSLIVEANAIDVAREPRIQDCCPLKRESPDGAHILDACWVLRDSDGRCPFLVENRCSIYATRPNVCVGFAAGSKQCVDLRLANGLRTLQPTDGDDIFAEISAGILEGEWE